MSKHADSISLPSGIKLPVSTLFTSIEMNRVAVITGHGLGPRNPKLRSHLNDEWIKILEQPCRHANLSHIAYTSRGHGESTGWEDTAECNPQQFTWQNLAHDMIAIADYYNISDVVTSGSSMGSATALFAAIQYPKRVNAVIMIRPPTAWETRKERQKYLLSSANKCRQNSDPSEKHYLVLRGAALADLPPLPGNVPSSDPTNLNAHSEHSHKHSAQSQHEQQLKAGIDLNENIYQNISCPVLILTVRGDDSHPVSTAEALSKVISRAELHVAENEEEANHAWPAIITDFLLRIISIQFEASCKP